MPDRETSDIEQSIADELLRIHVESYGTGAGSARVYINDEFVVAFLDDVELQKSEQFLLDSGMGDSIVEVRSKYQQAIEATFSAAVERATGRRVVSFVSATKLKPNYAVEIFRLGGRADAAADGLEEGLDAR